ncbi:biotin transporter BioY [Cellulomonas sp. ACRRI]|nr:biotin transporter BioY [Cellulomonas sp. ACRRI]MCG7287586.1 biotin transporter BioY [Cellulomonas sp. ACRRI]
MPITLQTFGVALTGLVLGPRRGVRRRARRTPR